MNRGWLENLRTTTETAPHGTLPPGTIITAWTRVMRRSVTLIFLAAWLLFWAPVTLLQAEIVPEIKYKSYPVEITTADRAYFESASSTPIAIDQKRFMGLTSWVIKYDYKYQQTSNLCQIKEVTVTNHCDITLPDFKGGDELLADTLSRFLQGLKEHELIHCRIATEYATKLKEKIKEIGQVQAQCENLEKTVQKEYTGIVEECRKAQSDFDAASKHGAHDGGSLDNQLGNLLAFPEQAARRDKHLGNLKEPEGSSGIYKDKDGAWRNH